MASVPALADPSPPAQTFSFYMGTVDQTALYDLGVDFGEDVQSGKYPETSLVVLDWGTPYCTTSGSTACGTYLVGGSGSYEGTLSERTAAQEFGIGFYVGTGSDTSARLFIAMGTNNSGSWVDNDTNAYNHGQAWANMVNDGESFFTTNGYGTQVAMRGGIDAELAWNPPGPTEQWADGYSSTGSAAYWDYGDANSCPPVTSSCYGGWGQYGVWFMSWGSRFAEPFSQVYNNSQAQEWGGIANYGYTNQPTFAAMQFLGPMSQHQACIDSGDSCSGTDNTSDQAWDDLYNNLNCGSCDVPQTPPHVTNIRWNLSV